MNIEKPDICRAAISALFAQPVERTKAEESHDNFIVSYTREDDKSFWDYKCQIRDDLILWGTPEGRWRTHKLDEKVEFKVSGDNLEISIIYPDGSSQTHSFSETQF